MMPPTPVLNRENPTRFARSPNSLHHVIDFHKKVGILRMRDARRLLDLHESFFLAAH